MKTKRTILPLLLFLLFIPQLFFAQIPNYSFENWTNGNPADWTTNNITGYLTPVTQSVIAHSGSYSARMEMMNSMLGMLQPVLNAGSLISGIPVSKRHNTFNFYYEFFPTSSTVYLVASVAMLKGGQIVGVAVGATKSSAGSFTKLTAPITYNSSQVPDAATIYITFIDSFFNTSTVGTYALLDDIYFDELTGISDFKNIPEKFSMEQNYPNPFNPSTVINYSVAERELVLIKIFDLVGKEVAILVNEEKPAGSYSVEFVSDGLKLSSGIYFYQMKSGNYINTKKMVLLK